MQTKHPPELKMRWGRLGYMRAMSRDFLGLLMQAAEVGQSTGIASLPLPFMGNGVLLLDADDVDVVLRHIDRFPRNAEANRITGRFFGSDGILTTEGGVWKKRRDQLSKSFAPRTIYNMLAPIQEVGVSHLHRWPIGRPFDLTLAFEEMIMEIFARIAFGGSQAECMDGQEVGRILRELGQILFMDFVIPGELSRFHPGFRRRKRQIDQLVQKLIENRKQQILSGQVESQDKDADMLTILVRDSLAAGESFEAQQILQSQLLNILVGANTTSAATLAWTCYVLLLNPEWYNLVQNEARVTGWARGIPTSDDLRKPKVTLALRETMRLWPAAVLQARECAEETTFQGYTFPAGTMVWVAPYVLHRLSKYFKDPETWNPEMHFPTPDDPCGYLPFFKGPHVCIGRALALAQMEIVLRELFAHYDLELAPGAEVKPQSGGALRPTGLQVILRAR